MPRQFILGSAYLSYEAPELPPRKEVEELVRNCRAEVIAVNNRNGQCTPSCLGEHEYQQKKYVVQFIMESSLGILNRGNKPTFVTSIRKEVLNITITMWQVSDEARLYRNTNFSLGDHDPEIRNYKNPRKTNWQAYGQDLTYSLGRIKIEMENTTDLEMAAGKIQDAIISAFNGNCPNVSRRSDRNVP